MADFADHVDFLGHRVGQANTVVEFLVDGHIDVFVDGRAQYRATVFTIEAWQIAAAAHEAHSQWCATDNHESAPSRVTGHPVPMEYIARGPSVSSAADRIRSASGRPNPRNSSFFNTR